MSRKRPLSGEEKQAKLLELFHETNDVYQLKDLERLAPQEKGIVLQSVKSTLQELVDSGLVQSDKIAGSLYYWAFPSESLKKSQRDLQEIETKTNKIEQSIVSAQSKLQEAQNSIDDSASADAVKKEINVLVQEKQSLEKQVLQCQQEVDYEELTKKQKNTQKILEAANRWTDNIFMTKTWCKKKFDKQERELNKAFGIPEELDYVDI